MSSSRYLVARGWIVVALLAFVGCSSTSPLAKTYPVRGAVLQDGKPITGGSIQFISASDPLLRVLGTIKEDGTFTLNTVKDNATSPGAPEGEYQVIVQRPLVKDASGGVDFAHKRVPPITLPKCYKVEAKENTFKIEMPES
jgi:hypothetical protein